MAAFRTALRPREFMGENAATVRPHTCCCCRYPGEVVRRRLVDPLEIPAFSRLAFLGRRSSAVMPDGTAFKPFHCKRGFSGDATEKLAISSSIVRYARKETRVAIGRFMGGAPDAKRPELGYAQPSLARRVSVPRCQRYQPEAYSCRISLIPLRHGGEGRGPSKALLPPPCSGRATLELRSWQGNQSPACFEVVSGRPQIAGPAA